jgi:hypothetical protein
MRKIGITLWVVAILSAAALSAALVRTNLLAGPSTRPSSTSPTAGSQSPTTTTTAPTTAPAGAPTSPPTVPTTSPNDPVANSPGDLFQALQHAAQRVMGNDHGNRSGRSDASVFSSWYQQLETAYGRALPDEVAHALYTRLFPDRADASGHQDADALACLVGVSPARTCPTVAGEDG